MSYYAHVHLEDPRSERKYEPGDLVPSDLPGLSSLIENKAIGSAPPERRVIALVDGTVVREIDSAGIETRTKHVKRFNGNFTPEEIKDPGIDTPLADVVHPQRTIIGPEDSIGADA